MPHSENPPKKQTKTLSKIIMLKENHINNLRKKKNFKK